MSAWACSRWSFPARLNSLAKNLAMEVDWAMGTPSTSRTGTWPNGVARNKSLVRMRTNASLYFFIAMIFDSEWIRTRIVYIHLGQVDIDSTSTTGVKTQLLSSELFRHNWNYYIKFWRHRSDRPRLVARWRQWNDAFTSKGFKHHCLVLTSVRNGDIKTQQNLTSGSHTYPNPTFIVIPLTHMITLILFTAVI